MGHPWLIVVLSLGAAFVFAMSSTLKHVSAGHVPDAQTLRPGLVGTFIRATLTHRLWLGGIGCDVVGLALQVIALHLGELAVVQPLLISGLLFTLILRQRYEGHHITAREFAWGVTVTAALAGFLALAATGRSPVRHESVDRLPAVIAGLVGLALTAACIELGRRQRAQGRSAALLGIAVGVVYAGSAAMLKAVTDIAVRSAARARHQLAAVRVRRSGCRRAAAEPARVSGRSHHREPARDRGDRPAAEHRGRRQRLRRTHPSRSGRRCRASRARVLARRGRHATGAVTTAWCEAPKSAGAGADAAHRQLRSYAGTARTCRPRRSGR